MTRLTLALACLVLAGLAVPDRGAAQPPEDPVRARWLASVKLPVASSWTLWRLRLAPRGKQIHEPVEEFPDHRACMAALEPRVFKDQDLHTMVFQVIDPTAPDANQFLGCFPTAGYYTRPYRER